MSSINDQLILMQSTTNQTKAAEKAASSTRTTELGQDAFLNLLLTELQNQNPLEPMGNTEFISQQAQFTQVNELQKLNDSLTTQVSQLDLLNTSTALNNQVMQASTLVGKDVTLVNPDNEDETISGTVTSANFSDGKATVTVGGKDYALNYITKIAQPSTGTTATTTTEES